MTHDKKIDALIAAIEENKKLCTFKHGDGMDKYYISEAVLIDSGDLVMQNLEAIKALKAERDEYKDTLLSMRADIVGVKAAEMAMQTLKKGGDDDQ